MMSSRIYGVNKINYLTLLLTKTTTNSKTHYALSASKSEVNTYLFTPSASLVYACNKKLKSILLVLSEIDIYLPFFVLQMSGCPCSATHFVLY